MAATGSQDGASSSNKQSTPVYHSADVTGNKQSTPVYPSADVTGKQSLKCLIFQ